MRLKILLPFQVFLECDQVSSIVVETPQGSFGMLERRLDCVAPLGAGILTYVAPMGEAFIAIDQGVLVKTGPEVVVSVRHAVGGTDLGKLREAVDREFLNLSEREKSVRSTMAKLESGFIHRFMEFQRS